MHMTRILDGETLPAEMCHLTHRGSATGIAAEGIRRSGGMRTQNDRDVHVYGMGHRDPRFDEVSQSRHTCPMVVYLDRERVQLAIHAGELEVYRAANGYLIFPHDVPQRLLLRIEDRYASLTVWVQKQKEHGPPAWPPLRRRRGATPSDTGDLGRATSPDPATVQPEPTIRQKYNNIIAFPGESAEELQSRRNKFLGDFVGGKFDVSLALGDLRSGNVVCGGCNSRNPHGSLFCFDSPRCSHPLCPEALMSFRTSLTRRAEIPEHLIIFQRRYGIRFERSQAQSHTSESRKMKMKKITRAQQMGYDGHAERYDVDIQYCVKQRQQNIDRDLTVPVTVPHGEVGSGNRLDVPWRSLEPAYLERVRWETTETHEKLRIGFREGLYPHDLMMVEPVVDISDIADPSAMPVYNDITPGNVESLNFSERIRVRDQERYDGPASADYRATSVIRASRAPSKGRGKGRAGSADAAGQPAPSAGRTRTGSRRPPTAAGATSRAGAPADPAARRSSRSRGASKGAPKGKGKGKGKSKSPSGPRVSSIPPRAAGATPHARGVTPRPPRPAGGTPSVAGAEATGALGATPRASDAAASTASADGAAAASSSADAAPAAPAGASAAAQPPAHPPASRDANAPWLNPRGAAGTLVARPSGEQRAKTRSRGPPPARGGAAAAGKPAPAHRSVTSEDMSRHDGSWHQVERKRSKKREGPAPPPASRQGGSGSTSSADVWLGPIGPPSMETLLSAGALGPPAALQSAMALRPVGWRPPASLQSLLPGHMPRLVPPPGRGGDATPASGGDVLRSTNPEEEDLEEQQAMAEAVLAEATRLQEQARARQQELAERASRLALERGREGGESSRREGRGGRENSRDPPPPPATRLRAGAPAAPLAGSPAGGVGSSASAAGRPAAPTGASAAGPPAASTGASVAGSPASYAAASSGEDPMGTRLSMRTGAGRENLSHSDHMVAPYWPYPGSSPSTGSGYAGSVASNPDLILPHARSRSGVRTPRLVPPAAAHAANSGASTGRPPASIRQVTLANRARGEIHPRRSSGYGSGLDTLD